MSAFVAAVVVGAATAYSAYQGYEAGKDQRRANRLAARQEAVRGQRERAQALRQNRINAATITAGSVASGLGGSSAVLGTLAAQGSNQASNFAFAEQINQLNAQRSSALDAAGQHASNAGIAGGVANIAALGFSYGAASRPAPAANPA